MLWLRAISARTNTFTRACAHSRSHAYRAKRGAHHAQCLPLRVLMQEKQDPRSAPGELCASEQLACEHDERRLDCQDWPLKHSDLNAGVSSVMGIIIIAVCFFSRHAPAGRGAPCQSRGARLTRACAHHVIGAAGARASRACIFPAVCRALCCADFCFPLLLAMSAAAAWYVGLTDRVCLWTLCRSALATLVACRLRNAACASRKFPSRALQKVRNSLDQLRVALLINDSVL